MSKATTIKDAIKNWEEKHPDQKISECKDVGFQFQWPPIEKMDNSLAALTSCQKLSLSTNMIEKIAGISAMRNLKILSLGRNYIKNFTGLEGVSETLEELWISYNFIEKIKGVTVLKKLKVLYMSNNLVKDWGEFNKLQDLPALEDLLFVGRPPPTFWEAAADAILQKKLRPLKNRMGLDIELETASNKDDKDFDVDISETSSIKLEDNDTNRFVNIPKILKNGSDVISLNSYKSIDAILEG